LGCQSSPPHTFSQLAVIPHQVLFFLEIRCSLESAYVLLALRDNGFTLDTRREILAVKLSRDANEYAIYAPFPG